MLVPLGWLKEHVQIDGSLNELSHLLSMAGLEVDAIEERAALPEGVVLATVLALEPHENADRLQIVTVADGPDSERKIVCGARNMGVGDRVILATPGCKLPNGLKIKKSKVRGIESPGMLCGADEVGLDADTSGLLLLGNTEADGTPLLSLMGGAETVLELGLTPNRPDCLSIEGVARETSGLMHTVFTPAKIELPAPEAGAVDDFAKVENLAPDECPYYIARVLTDVSVGPSPAWLVKRLSDIGMRSINNIVDATNFVMLELGQPLHAFDLDKLKDQTVNIRLAQSGEKLTFLDGVERELVSEDLVICDADAPLALAGVMGGEDSGVSAGSTRLLLESAYFNPSKVRRSARRHGFHTESSHRFERGVDPQGQRRGIDRLAEIILKVAGGKLAEGVITAGPGCAGVPEIPVRLSYLRSLLGLDIDAAGVESSLKALDIDVRRNGDGSMVAIPPSYRVDLKGEADLAEEVARSWGYDRVPLTLPSASINAPTYPSGWREMRDLETFLASQGAHQAVNFAFISPKALNSLGLGEGDPRLSGIGLLKPLSEDMSVMRTTLLPSILSSVARNQNRQTPDLTLFEIGRSYHQKPEKQVDEISHLMVATAGRRYERTWDSPGERAIDLFDLRGLLESSFAAASLAKVDFIPNSSEPFLVASRSWELQAQGVSVGYAGLVRPQVAKAFGVDGAVLVAEVALPSLVEGRNVAQVRALPVYPKVNRDLALVVAVETPAGEVLSLIDAMKEPLVESLQLFDIYEGKQLPEGKKSLGVAISYRSADKTLTEADVSDVHSRILDGLKETFGADLRA